MTNPVAAACSVALVAVEGKHRLRFPAACLAPRISAEQLSCPTLRLCWLLQAVNIGATCGECKCLLHHERYWVSPPKAHAGL